MIQNVFWIFCLCLQLMTVHSQLDLPNSSVSRQPVPKQPPLKTQVVTQNPPRYNPQQYNPQQYNPQQYNQQQYSQQQPLINNYSPNYAFNQPQPQSPYPYNNFIAVPIKLQRQPVIQINNQRFQSSNTTRPGNYFNVFGRLDSNFGPGHFGNDYIGQLRQPPPVFTYPNNFGQYPNQNLVEAPALSPTNSENPRSEPKSEELPSGQIPQPPPIYGNYGQVFGPTLQPGSLQFTPNQPNFDPNGQIVPPNHPQQFQPFAPNFGRFDFGHNVAPPQTIEHNLQVTGPTIQNGGAPLPSNPVVGFYGPPPNLGVFAYPTFSPGYTYPSGQDNQFVNPDPESEAVDDQPLAINPK